MSTKPPEQPAPSAPGPTDSSPIAHGPGAKMESILANVGGQFEQLRDIQQELRGQEEAIGERERQVAERESLLETQNAAFQAQQAGINVDVTALSEMRDDFEAERTSWTEEQRVDRQQLTDEAAALGQRAETLANDEQTLAVAREDLEQEAAAIRVTATEMHERHEAEGAERDRRRQSAETALSEREADLERREVEVAELGEALVADREALESTREREDTELRARMEETSLQLETSETRAREAAEQIQSLQTRVEHAEQTRGELQTRMTDLEQELQQSVDEVRQASARVESVEAELETSLRQRDDSVAREEESSAKLAELASKVAARSEVGADVRLRAMKQRIAKLEAEVAGRKKQKAPTPANGGQLDDLRMKARRLAQVAEHLRRRQSRLHRLRGLLRTRPASATAERTVPATVPVDYDQRSDQLRRLEKLHHGLAERRATLGKIEKHMTRKWARARSIVLAGWLVFIIVVAAGASWGGGQWLTPPTRTASVRFEAKTRLHQKMTEEEAEEWQSWHKALLHDAGFHEEVARRMDRRRIERYASAEAVRDAFTNDASVTIPKPGNMVLTLTGTRPAELTTALDVIATAIVSESGRQRRQRSGKAWATTAGERKEQGQLRYSAMDDLILKDDRPLTAGVLFGFAFATLLLVIIFVHRRLMKVKREFDDDGTLFADMPAVP